MRANTVRPSVDCRLDDNAFGAETFSWQDPVHSWKAGPGEVMTVENLFIFMRYFTRYNIMVPTLIIIPSTVPDYASLIQTGSASTTILY